MRWAGQGMGVKKNAYRISVGKTEGNRPLGRQRHGWVDNIEMDWIYFVEDRDQWKALLNTIMNIRVP
jgi:hypothetical protein